MYYNRVLSSSFSALIERQGKLEWLVDFVKNRNDLDFLIGKNSSKEWISIYRGLSKILTIVFKQKDQSIRIEGDEAYKTMQADLYQERKVVDRFDTEINLLISKIDCNPKFDRYYKNKKEGYYQNELSRRFGICGKSNDEFVIIDKEAVIGYADEKEKNQELGKIRTKYKSMQTCLTSLDSCRYGKNIDKKSVGNELDFLALSKNGDILLIEYKHGTNTSGIYLSPIQIGMYYDMFVGYSKKNLDRAVFDMLKQKQEIGLICPDWKKPDTIKSIIPVLIISEYNYRSTAKEKFDEVLSVARQQIGPDFLNNLKVYNYTDKTGLTNW